MKPEDRAHRRWPVPKNVSLILVPGQRLSEYDLARIHEHFAVLYSVIDGMTEERQSAEPVPDVGATLKRHHERLAAIEELLARPKGFSAERLNRA
jgi:hypothetical protein